MPVMSAACLQRLNKSDVVIVARSSPIGSSCSTALPDGCSGCTPSGSSLRPLPESPSKLLGQNQHVPAAPQGTPSESHISGDSRSRLSLRQDAFMMYPALK
eukprot:gnl/TRDRNA2_/TRDRNA2_172078_c3_seq1.p1 gnl/TRDRNA2_/TRDRNA2_172078_c3~~gnl/TRDRNA2_/TRDRNA2_172078_c3_seq1.p1  ORF type:complete len:101 (+),score=12.00 gnl/TRDRNA2_/TRDRNA2_172078_c3_seq1:24-326(+)